VGWVADVAWPPRSGIGTYAFCLMANLASQGVPLTLIHHGHPEPLAVGPHDQVLLPRWASRRFLRRLVPPLLSPVRHLALIHFPTEFDLWYPRPGAARRVVTIHGCAGSVLEPGLHHQVRPALVRRMARALAGVEAVVTVSESSAREISLVYGLPRRRITVIPNGISPAYRGVVPAPPAWYAAALGFDGPYLLAVGLMLPKKNQVAILHLLRALADRGHPHRLVLVGGPGPAEPLLREEARRLRLADRFLTLGFQEEGTLARLYAGASLFVFPSFHEGFGIPVVEAMAAGCPVLASRIGALEEVTGGVVPLVDPADREGMALEGRRILEDGAHRDRVVSAGRLRAERYSWESSASSLAALYRQVLGA
jgi:glycosyltransferase involved in cell wall biosynthesis